MKYIHHDTSAADDEKLAELIIEHGYEGYGLFWAILEKIGKQEKPIKTSVLKRQLNVGKRLEKCWSFMESIGLIYSNNGDTFNKQLLNYAGSYKIKKEKTAERVSEWRKNQEDTENVTRYTEKCNAPVTPPNISKENRSKENTSTADAGGGLQPETPKKPPPKKEKGSAQKEKVTEHWQALVDEWHRFYGNAHNSVKPTFNGAAGSSLKQIMALIKQRAESQTVFPLNGWDQQTAVQCLRDYLTKAWQDPWLKRNFLLTNLLSKYDTIVNGNEQPTTKNGTANGGTVNAHLKRNLAERLANAAGQSGTGPT